MKKITIFSKRRVSIILSFFLVSRSHPTHVLSYATAVIKSFQVIPAKKYVLSPNAKVKFYRNAMFGTKCQKSYKTPVISDLNKDALIN